MFNTRFHSINLCAIRSVLYLTLERYDELIY